MSLGIFSNLLIFFRSVFVKYANRLWNTGMAHNSIIIMVSFNFGCFLLGLVLYVIPILQEEDPMSFTAVKLCSGKMKHKL